MESIQNYDNWKTTPPDEPRPIGKCSFCGKDLFEGDHIYTIDGFICEACLEDNFGRIL